jgi:hypothetical protein
VSNKFLGGLITNPPLILNPAAGNAANGVFTLSQYTQAVQNGTWPSYDPYYEYNTLLLHGNGANGATNNIFLDSSTNNFTITRVGNTSQGTFTPFSKPNGYWSNYFDGTDDRLTIADNILLRPGTSNFTIEAWVYRATAGAAHTIFAKGGASTGFVFGITSTNLLRFTDTTSNIDSTGTVAAGVWVHVAVVREGTGSNQLKLYINGVADGQGTVSTDFNQTEEARIGENRGATDDFNGYISNFRYVIGSAIYTASFTPSVLPLTSTSQGASSGEVELLTCQSNRFVDNSPNNFAITRVNNVSVVPRNPFTFSSVYNPAVNGGSGHFDGTDDRLTIADNAALRPGTSNFTIEAWVYRNVVGVAHTIFAKGGASTGFVFGITSGNVLRFTHTTTNIDSTGIIPATSWNHVAVVREGTGTNEVKLYINGVQDGQGTVSTNFNQTEEARIGENRGATEDFNGYISSFRYVVGTAVYTSAFTPPTAPLTAITNTSLLTNFTNASIFDNTGFNALETVGNAQIDTSVSKFGGASMEFDGTGDYLVVNSGPPLSPSFAFGSGNFTIEFWYNSNTVGAEHFLYDSRPASTNGAYCTIYKSTGNVIIFYANTGIRITGTTALAIGVWYYISVCRSAGLTKLFINGTQDGATYADTTVYLNGTNRPIIAASGSSLGATAVNGFMDELRVTNGVARYTSNFDIPYLPDRAFPLNTQPYPLNTTLLLPGTGTDGAQNNTFLDSSTNNFTITRFGNTTQGSFSPFSRTAGEWGVFLDGGASVGVANLQTAFAGWGGRTRSFEAWIFIYSYGSGYTFQLAYAAVAANGRWGLQMTSAGFLSFYWTISTSATAGTTSTLRPILNQWNHIAFCVDSTVSTNTTVYFGLNGVVQSTTGHNLSTQGTTFTLSNLFATASFNPPNLAGVASNVRWSNNIRYTSDYTVPTAPFVNDGNTIFLGLADNTFVDKSSAGEVVTPAGNASMSPLPLSPFSGPVVYDPATNGGTGYFDGTGDYLTIPDNAAFDVGSGNFTAEAWVFPTASPNQPIIMGHWSGSTGGTTLSWVLALSNNANRTVRFLLSTNGSAVLVDQVSSTALRLNSWNHVALVRNGDVFTVYANGVAATGGSYTISAGASLFNATNVLSIGATSAGTQPFQGNIADARFVVGTAVYTANFTPPTAPLTAITNTQLLCNFTNAGVYDAAMTNVFETAGNAQISTLNSKWGGGSIYFDGSGDWLTSFTRAGSYTLGSVYTIQLWFITTTIAAGNAGIINLATTISGNTGISVYRSGSEIICNNGATGGTGPSSGTGAIAANTWTYLSIVSDGGSTKLYLNGVQRGNFAGTTGSTSAMIYATIGSFNDKTGPFFGYISDVRILKSIALGSTALQTSQWQDQ